MPAAFLLQAETRLVTCYFWYMFSDRGSQTGAGYMRDQNLVMNVL